MGSILRKERQQKKDGTIHLFFVGDPYGKHLRLRYDVASDEPMCSTVIGAKIKTGI